MISGEGERRPPRRAYVCGDGGKTPAVRAFDKWRWGKTPAVAGVCVWRGWGLYRRCGECGVDFAFDVEVVVEDGVEILSQEIDAFFL